MVTRYDLIVIGAGPAGLSAAIEAAKHGIKPIVFDENAKPGGQLFKQIHKFFGSKEHKAKIRGFKIGRIVGRGREVWSRSRIKCNRDRTLSGKRSNRKDWGGSKALSW